MTDIPWLYLGPLGALRALPSPDVDWSEDQETVGGEHTAMTGRKTRFVLAFRRSWEIDFPLLLPDQLAYLEACYMNLHAERLYLVDPLRWNRLDRWLSTGSAERSSAPTAKVSAGQLETSGEVPEDLPLGRSIRLHKPQDGTTVEGTVPNPVVPGERLKFSAYVKGKAAPSLVLLDADDQQVTDAEGDAAGGDEWERVSVALDVPEKAAYAVVRLTVQGDADDAYTTGWQLTKHEGADWVPGTGSPEVYVSELKSKTPRYPLVTASMTIQEV
ncbi:hypothetical protein [Sciscionella marina]|uniref:hypothetical protein n=1 Tax=Sciscionella marina TaxID=508770 RepID=UPI0003A5CC16|nr:hypothetical protein [Sciscionella marina]